jgi:hypothetical protein
MALACLLKIVEIVNSPGNPAIIFCDDGGGCALTVSYGDHGCHSHIGAGPRLAAGNPEDAERVTRMVGHLFDFLSDCGCKEREKSRAETVATEADIESILEEFRPEPQASAKEPACYIGARPLRYLPDWVAPLGHDGKPRVVLERGPIQAAGGDMAFYVRTKTGALVNVSVDVDDGGVGATLERADGGKHYGGIDWPEETR